MFFLTIIKEPTEHAFSLLNKWMVLIVTILKLEIDSIITKLQNVSSVFFNKHITQMNSAKVIKNIDYSKQISF